MPALLAPYAFHKQCCAHDLAHVLGHVVGAQRNSATTGFEFSNTRTQSTPSSNGGVKGNGGTGGAQETLLFCRHTPTVGRHQARREKVTMRQVCPWAGHRGARA